ncbi:MAG TPA: riboflavin synthase [Actinomycetota bacterium]|nr:riboflavin synthase [Actinomycetota bacterium]
MTAARRTDGVAQIAVTGPKVAEDAEVGSSVAVSGVCLTVVERRGDGMSFDVVDETLSRTTLGDLRAGDVVNLERPVTLATRLGGHLVQGHADAVGTVRSVEWSNSGSVMAIEAAPDVLRYVVEKGSVAVDGVSLTVARAGGDAFDVALVPHTLAVTTLGERDASDRVNLEIDIVAKYIEGLIGRPG